MLNGERSSWMAKNQRRRLINHSAPSVDGKSHNYAAFAPLKRLLVNAFYSICNLHRVGAKRNNFLLNASRVFYGEFY